MPQDPTAMLGKFALDAAARLREHAANLHAAVERTPAEQRPAVFVAATTYLIAEAASLGREVGSAYARGKLDSALQTLRDSNLAALAEREDGSRS